jgi:hypothetical protein
VITWHGLWRGDLAEGPFLLVETRGIEPLTPALHGWPTTSNRTTTSRYGLAAVLGGPLFSHQSTIVRVTARVTCACSTPLCACPQEGPCECDLYLGCSTFVTRRPRQLPPLAHGVSGAGKAPP